MPKEDEGLGVKGISSFNLSLLGKWKWNLFQRPGELWVKVLESKYGGWRGLSEDTSERGQSIWWRDLKLMFQHPQHGVTMSNTILWKVGSRGKFKFWEDTWLGGEDTLLQRYPRLYIISSQQNQIIQQMGAFRDTGWEWDLRWRRPLFDSEMGMAVSFLMELERFRIQPHSDDQWVWKAEPSGQYTARSAYGVLWGEVSGEHQDEAFKELWNLKLLPKIAIFAWRLIRNRLPTKSNLWRDI